MPRTSSESPPFVAASKSGIKSTPVTVTVQGEIRVYKVVALVEPLMTFKFELSSVITSPTRTTSRALETLPVPTLLATADRRALPGAYEVRFTWFSSMAET